MSRIIFNAYKDARDWFYYHKNQSVAMWKKAEFAKSEAHWKQEVHFRRLLQYLEKRWNRPGYRNLFRAHKTVQ